MDSLNGKSILTVIENICAFGTRWMGSKGAEETLEYVSREFKKIGMTVELQEFRFPHYQPISASLVAGTKLISCQPIALSPSTEKPLEADLVYGGQCTNEGLGQFKAAGIDLHNKIVLSDNLRSFVSYPEVEAAGAAGFISITNLTENVIRCGCARLDGKVGTIPAVAIGGVDGRDIVSHLSKRVNVHASLQSQGHIREIIGHNVIAKHPDAEPPKLLVTAHYDCFWNGVMAMDNCAGVATVIALNKAFTPDMRKMTEFVLFGAEELGCWGSAGYVHDRREHFKGINAVLNLDTFGSNKSGVEIGVTKDLEENCRKVVEKGGIEVNCWNIPPRAASDHHKFVENGFSAIWIANGGTDARYHTPLDIPSEMSIGKLEAVANLAYCLAAGLLEV
jgi:Iap family predicted aminopeptidase